MEIFQYLQNILYLCDVLDYFDKLYHIFQIQKIYRKQVYCYYDKTNIIYIGSGNGEPIRRTQTT